MFNRTNTNLQRLNLMRKTESNMHVMSFGIWKDLQTCNLQVIKLYFDKFISALKTLRVDVGHVIPIWQSKFDFLELNWSLHFIRLISFVALSRCLLICIYSLFYLLKMVRRWTWFYFLKNVICKLFPLVFPAKCK